MCVCVCVCVYVCFVCRYITDWLNNRMLVFAQGNTTAMLVYGQPNMTSSAVNAGRSSPSSQSFSAPQETVLDSSRNV